jgi:DNA-binding IclR family transcriptional regulator
MNNTLANGLALLGFLSRTADSFGVSELATALKLPKSHVHRLLQTLVETGYAVQEDDRRYRVGLRPLEVSSALLHHLPLRAAALPVLHRLSKATGMDAIVTIPHDGAGVNVGAVYPDGRQVDPAAAIGSRLMVGHTATGKLFAVCIPGFAAIDLGARESAQIRRARFAVKDPALGDGFNGMAALVGDPATTIHGALGMSGPGEHFRRAFERASGMLRSAADELATSLAHLRPTA